MFKTPNDVIQLNAAITRLLVDMEQEPTDSEAFAAMSKQLEALYKIKATNKPAFLPSADSMLMAATNLGGLLLIMNHERAHVIASKALGFVNKIR